MNTVIELLDKLANEGVRLSVEAGQLNCYAPKGALTPALREAIRKHQAELIALLEGRSRREAPYGESAVEFPLSAGQKGLYILQKLYPSMSAYNVPMAFRIKGGLDVELLAAAWDAVLDQYPILKVRFLERDGVLYQRMDEACRTKIRQENIELVEDATLVAFLKKRAKKPFHPNEGPLTRIELFNRGGAESILMVTIHHLLIDGTSGVIVLRSLLEFYQQLIENKPVRPARDLAGYQEFVAWEESMLASREGEVHAGYWKKQLEGELPVIELTSDRPRPLVATFEGMTLTEQLPGELAQWLHDYSKAQSIPASAIFLALFQLVLHRFTDQEDVIVGMPVMGRAGQTFLRDVGYFVNMVPLRTRCEPGLKLSEFLRRVQGTMMDGLFHSSYPFPLMVEALPAQTGGGRNPVFQVMYAYQNFVTESMFAASLQGLSFEIAMIPEITQEGEFDLALEVFEDGPGFSMSLKYNPDLYQEKTIRCLFESYFALLRSVRENHGRSLGEYSIVSEKERERVLVEFNDTKTPYPHDKCFHQLFAEQAALHGDRAAVIGGDERLAYRELQSRSRDLALYLQSQGVGPDGFVGLCMERSVDLIVALLGIMEAGAAYVPLDPSHPNERIRFMLEDSGTAIVLTQEALADRLAAIGGEAVRTVVLDRQWEEIRAGAAAATAGGIALEERVRPENLAYMIYTSGSTGKPKGVMLEHRSLVNYLSYCASHYVSESEGECASFLHFPLTFDASITSLYVPLLIGKAIDLNPGGGIEAFAGSEILGRGYEFIKLTPAHLTLMKNSASNLPAELLAKKNLLVVGGEALTWSHIDFLCRPGSAIEVVNEYGPTETTVGCTTFRFACGARRDGASETGDISIGAPIANTQIHVLDRNRNLQPIGVPGELYIAGAGLARGYLNRPDLTEESFVPNPFQPGTRMYKSGDLGRWREDGTLQYLGRADMQTKIRGYRIEPGEIEVRMMEHEGVQDAVVMTRQDTPGEKRLVAYFTPSPEHASSVVRYLRLRKTKAGAAASHFTLPNGLVVFDQNQAETDSHYDEIFGADDSLLQHGVTLSDGDCVFDVGADIGMFSLFVDQRCRNAAIYAFEPIPKVFASLQLNAALYDWNGRLYQHGLGEAPGQRVSDIIRENEIPRIDLLKIGVECAAGDVLRGIQPEDWPKIRQIVVDIDDVAGRRTEIVDLLESHGYEVSHAQSRSLDSAALYNVYAVRRTAAGGSGRGAERPSVAEAVWNSPDILVRDLRAFLLERLPEYMVPSAFVPLDAMPLSPHGKLDRKALPAPEGGPFALRTYEPPRGDIETALAAIWRDILKIERVGRNDNFFELGGHSLLATQVVSRIQMQMGLDIPLKTVFEVTNFAQQAACLEKAEQSRIPPIVPVDRSKFERLPMSFAEERVWFIHQLVPEGAAVYSSPGAFIVHGDLDVDQMNEAYNLIIARHESLRTVFPIDEDGLAHRVVLDHLDFKVRFVDLSGYDENVRDARVQDLCLAEARTPFDLTTGPLMRGHVFKIAEQVYIVMINLHHIISDGWSIGVLAREFRTIMEALRAGRAPELPTLPIQYADYAIWQRQWLEQGGLQQSQLAYWKRQLTGLPESLDLPTDYPRPRVLLFKGATLQFEMNAQLVGELRRLGERHGATLYMVLLAAYNALLHRLTDRSDICVGGLIANRNHVATEDLIGMFVNTLALRNRVEGDDTVHELLSRVRGTCLEAYENQDAPFPAIVEMMNLRVNPSVSPFFQTLFFLQTAGYDELDYGTQRYFMDTGYAKYDISVELVETAEGLSGGFEFNTDLFNAETITRMMEHFVAICRGMVNNPAARVRDLDYVSEAEKSRVLGEFNPARSEVPSVCLHELFTEQVAQYSDKSAIVWGVERLTYQQLDERSGDLALYLQSLGVKPDSLVGLCMERSPDLVVGLLAILRAGGAYVPLDPNYPDKRLAYMVRDSQAKIVLTQDSLSEKLRDLVSTETQLLSLDGQEAEIAQRVVALKAGGASLRRDVEPHHLAYLIYTSGSTGRPKGVAIEHHSPVNLVQWARGVYSREELAGVMAATSVCFDLSIFEMFVPLANGGTIILVPNALGLLDLPNRGSVTLINTVPSAMEELVRLSAVPDSVQTVNLAGEPLSPRLVDKIYDTTPVRKVYDLYGPSETTTYSTFVLRTKNGPQTIGRPIANTQVYILDEHRQIQPIGVPGELYIGGDGVTRGYLNRPDLTDERFVANPFEPGTRMYKTGDRARWMDDGTLQYLGRIDTQVKVRGFRIELGEIEARLNECRGILESAVVAQGEGAEKRLVAFYRAKETTADRIVDVPQDELRTLLTRTLPDYMVPSAFVSVAAIPLNANGKVDRQTLAQIDVKATSDREYVAPRNDLEAQLAAMYAEVLSLPPDSVGIHDSFFDLGGHSLFAVQLHSRINARLKRSLPLLDIFTKKTIAELVVSVEAAKPSEIPPIRPVDRSQIEHFPLSFAEERIWFMSQLVGDDAILYSVPGAFVIRGGKDLSRLDEALNLIIGRHEILRTVFPRQEGQAHQRILDHLAFRLERIDLSTLENREERDRKAKEICQADALAPFDLATGPLIRGKVIRLSEDEHILMLNMHHIISDGWSLGVLVKELTVIMDAFEQGKRPELAPLPIQYADYSVWQRRWLEESGVLDRQLAYWQQKLAGIPESLDLATDFPRPSIQRYVGARHSFTLDAQLTAQLKRLAEREGGTLFMVLLAVFKALLHRYTGQEDICVGSPIANRQYPETEELIGMFVNTLALRSRVAEDEPFVELLARVTETCLEAYENQNAPFERVVDIAHPQRNLAISPLFQVVLLLQNIEMGPAHPLIQPYPLESGISKFDITLEFTETTDGLSGLLEYNTDLFRPGTVASMAGHFRALCQAVTAAPETRVRDLSYTQDSERQQLLVAFNDTQANYPKDKCIHQLFTERVAIDPERTAVVFGSRTLSYRELHETSGDLALWLQAQGVWPDRIVGLCLERSVEMMVGIMGAAMAGGGYLPLDPVYPDERLKYMLQDSEPPVVLTQERFRERITALASPDTKVIALDTQWAEIERSIAALKSGNMVLRTDVRPRHLSYVIYTSGSTGNPKGVMVEHQALVNRIVWMQKQYHLNPEDVVLQKTPYSFDVSVWEFFWPVMAGASVVFAAPEGHKDVQYLGNLINESKVTTLHFVPSMLNAFLNNAQAVCPSVRQIFCSGEALDRKAVDTYRTRFPHAALHNLYGPTEAAIDVTAYDCTQLADAVVPIGSPISNIQIYILDRHNRPQPIGVPGELHIAGDGVARGYLNRPELTRDKFVPNPFQPGTRMYKTGDLARWRNDGTIEYLGRNDFQVKLRGFRIELGEIEARLMEHEGVKEAVVLAREDTPGAKRLVAYYTPSTEVDVAEKGWSSPESLIRDLRAFLGERLPEYMLPSAYVPLDQMPLTSNGKLDRKALPAPEAGAFALRAYEPPQGEIEVALAAIWSDILKIERVGRNDDFFELGGHSLSAVQLISRINTRLNRSLSLLDIFTKKTIAELAAAVDAAKLSEIPTIEPVDHAQIERFPLSFAEERIWFMSQLVGEDAILYSVPGAFVIRGEKDLSRLDEALNLIIERHEILRTVFPSHEGQAYQRILDHLAFRLERIDLSTLENGEERDRKAKEICQADALAPFDLATGPLIRGKVIRLSEDEHILMLNMHHIISDGWSLGVLVKELTVIMDAFEQGKRPELAPLPIQYADYSVWQRRWLEESGVLDRQLAYWQQKLAGIPESLDLATDFPRPSMQRYVGARHTFTLDAQLTAQLKRLAEREGGTLFMVLLAVFKALLHRYTGQEDICVGSPIANRQYPETEELIGMFVNTLALRSRVAEDEPFVELLARVTETCLEAYENQNAPFERVVDIAHPQRNLAISPLFQVVLLLQNIEMGPAHPLIQPYPLESGISKFDLTLEFTETADGLSGSLEYSTDLFRPGTVARMAGHFRALCQAVTAAPETRVRDLSYMQDSERQQLLVAFNDTQANYPKDKCIHQLFTERVAVDPEKTAVVFGSRALSYRELHETSGDLALWLQAQGVEPDRIVGLGLERSVEMMVGIMGTSMAGGAYLPLDPVYPDERLKYMLQDSEPPVVLTQERFRGRIAALASPDTKVIALDTQWAEIESGVAALKSGKTTLRNDVRPGHLSYVIYTSGSTGNPKGVMVEHQALVNRIVWMQKQYQLNPEDVVLQKTPYSFDVSVWEFFWPVMAGASVVFAAPEGHKDVQYLGNLINESKVTTLHFVPSMLNAFLNNAQGVCPSVRQIFCSGEALDRKAVDTYRTRFPHAALHNLYGPTEAAIDVTAYDCTQLPDAVVPIGSPISNIQIYILDRHDHPQPIGVPGELHIAGDGLARGYLNRPELTRDKFVSNPFRPGARMYKTGDLARWRNDGAVEYLGRNDFQVKVRGFRIELGEIEARLMEHEGVQEAVVLAREDTPGEKRLVAYFTPSSEHASTVGRFLRIRKTAAGAAAKYYTLPNGSLVFHQNQSETEFLYDEIFNEDIYLKHGLTLHDGDCIFDVGANIGLFSLFVTQRCKNATVYAFEPIPTVFESLQLNAMLHNWGGRVYQCGLAETSRQETFTFYPHNTVISSSMTSREEAREIVKSYMLKRQGSSGTGDQALADTDEVLEARLDTEDYTCELRPISDVIRENAIERIDLLKIDVEKAELDVLRGIRDEDWPKIRQLVVEVHDVSGRLAEIVGMLEGLGYQVGHDQNELLASSGLYNLYAVRRMESRVSVDASPVSRHDVTEKVWSSPESLIRDLRGFLGERLPEYMLPSAFVPLTDMPLTPNGKLDRKALPAPEAGAFALRAYEPPQGEIEEALAAIWSEALKIERVGRNDDFFELGGHSLSAVQLISRINKRFLRSLPLLVIFKSPSVAAFAKLLSGEEAASFDIVVPIQTGGEAPPVFGVPGAGATVLSLLPIAKALGAKQPFYGLQAVGLDGSTPPLKSVEQTAQVNVAALKKVRAQGPYSLIGHSYGGVVAYEMARILLEQGEEVASLTLLDSIAPWVVQEQYGPALLAETDQAIANPDDDGAKLQLERLASLLNDIGQEIDPAQFAAAREVYLANLACYAAYEPSMLPKTIDVSLYRAGQKSPRTPALPDDYGWNRLLQSPIRIHDVEGDHYSMLKNLQLLEIGAPALVN